MRRRVSMWVVIALVGALAATTAAVVVLATNDHDGRAAARPMMQSGDPGPWQMPVAGVDRHGWGHDGDAGLLPWVLFAIATGTAAGLLVAWSPWRRTPAPVTAGGGTPPTPGPDAMAQAPVAVTMPTTTEVATPDVATTDPATTQIVATPEARAPEADTK